MILGVGIDLVRVSRLEGWLEGGIAERFFHPDEVAACRGKGTGAVESLAARFGAKEAFGKALGTGIVGFKLKDIEVYSLSNGQPQLRLHGSARAAADAAGAVSIHLSLSHEPEYAAAMVVLEG